MAIESLNIYQRMSAITNEVNRVAKNLTVGEGKNKYKAAGEADVLAAVKPAEEKFGVFSYPFDREIIESGILTTVGYNGQERKQQFMRLRTVYRFVNMDKPEEYIDIATYGDGVDSQDKAPGKAMTYGDKYALLKAYKIITGEDPDQSYSEDLRDKERSAQPTPMISEKQLGFMKKLASDQGRQSFVMKRVKEFGKTSMTELTMHEATDIIGELKQWNAEQN